MRRLFNEKLLAYNGNIIPSDSPHMLSFARELVKIAKDIYYEDRIYMYLDYLHDILYKRKEYLIDKACLANIESVAAKTREARSVWLIHAIELSYKNNDFDLCRRYVQEIVEINNSFVPGLYYQYLLELNLQNKERYHSYLIEKYSKHWMIQDRFLSKKE